ncbi:3-hydroxyacyl-ACP dehydratase FabZ family protein [Burkholderia stagnalis]|uniref:3-hydroxyacyl-ACP dehydratase FabZ family protein n=1 Tax=Burkholderia stagnalis TaxID=1503054 RepID=UPI00075AD597|nr:3-hydroxyacyl-ACP dehydratase FabZ family protein [Burkholderia stagnalis]KVM99397.1 hydroxymyristoyl-ACP dehydratase [Burkholderia stagnalis]KVN53421.1 hydroxymyristoyl-ACP dehydratase [Burkholderia stagnalis]KWD93604.1 hydroxymyristoyl-ACP dehydratase [Burkholderia stagnalis]KWE09668.1 hydroxymyristoyl-ACP dehydratase [Burkholderia stagnalis]KWO77373.1 hydroxymyristoyl-ACP dehydratase [Burkholderia stagnalis]
MTAAIETGTRLDAADVLRCLPHRAPFLFVDHAQVDAAGAAIVGHRTFQPDEPWFAGHFPGDPLVPGVVLIEFVAQTANLLVGHLAGGEARCHLVGVRNARFLQPVRPAQAIEAHVRAGADGALPRAGGIATFDATVLRDGARCMSATVTIYLTQ